jgi:hypothetical protein
MVGALAAAVIALVASAAVAMGVAAGPSSGRSGIRGYEQGQGTMGGQGQGQGMMGGYGGDQGSGAGRSNGFMGRVWLPGNGAAVSSIPAARARAATAAQPAGLHPGEVMWFDNGFYVELKDSAGKPATEVIVDPAPAR